MKTLFTRCLVTAVLLSNTACVKASEEARRDFILGADHGWVDLAAVPAVPALDKACLLSLSMNGETLVTSAVQLPQDGAAPVVGFRMPVPVGKLAMDLAVSGCVAKDATFKVLVDMPKDHLARLEFDGKALQLKGISEFEPTTLEWVRTEVLRLQAESSHSAKAMAQLSNFAIASLALNALLLLTVLAGFLKRPK